MAKRRRPPTYRGELAKLSDLHSILYSGTVGKRLEELFPLLFEHHGIPRPDPDPSRWPWSQLALELALDHVPAFQSSRYPSQSASTASRKAAALGHTQRD